MIHDKKYVIRKLTKKYIDDSVKGFISKCSELFCIILVTQSYLTYAI